MSKLFKCKIISAFNASDGTIKTPEDKFYVCSEEDADRLVTAQCLIKGQEVKAPADKKGEGKDGKPQEPNDDNGKKEGQD